MNPRLNTDERPVDGATVADVKRVHGASGHRVLFHRAADHASAFRDQVADRAPRAAISAAAPAVSAATTGVSPCLR